MFKIELVLPNVFFGRMVMLRKEKKKKICETCTAEKHCAFVPA